MSRAATSWSSTTMPRSAPSSRRRCAAPGIASRPPRASPSSTASCAADVPDVLVTDVVLPDGNGLDMVARARRARIPQLPVIVLSAQNTLTTAVRATEVGAYEYLPKPFDLDELTRAVDGALARQARRRGRARSSEDRALPLIGRSPAMQDVYRVIARVVSNDLTVLVSGESGTGKELVARAIHDLGPRRAAPFVAINMAAIPRELIEAELFGHERGAFTGAQARNAGRFEQAAGGTLFLDEIGDMPMEAQTRLLRVLQSGEFTTVGGARTIRADVRIVAATNRDSPQLVADGPVPRGSVLPPQRRAGRAARAARAAPGHRAARPPFPRSRRRGRAAAQAARRRRGRARSRAHDWPGNVRELENIMRRLAVLTRDERDRRGRDLARMLGAPRAPAAPATIRHRRGGARADRAAGARGPARARRRHALRSRSSARSNAR